MRLSTRTRHDTQRYHGMGACLMKEIMRTSVSVPILAVGLLVWLIGCGSDDSTWTDPRFGLTWQNPDGESGIRWEEARHYCESLVLDDYSDWRVPTIWELRTLIRGCPPTQVGGECPVVEGDCLAKSCRNESCDGCSDWNGPADGCYWPDGLRGSCSTYWSSSAVEDSAASAWVVTFLQVSVDPLGDTNKRRVRCVR